MAQPRNSSYQEVKDKSKASGKKAEKGDGRKSGAAGHKKAKRGKKGKDDADPKKTQAQRLLEFEMWTSDKALKDLEYSQRRSEKKQRRRDKRKDARNRCWKKVYAPAVLSMAGGTFLTMCGTLQSLGGDTFLWDARATLVVLGPVMVAAGFVGLMLAAACTFQHDQQARVKPRDSLTPELGLLLTNGFRREPASRPSTVQRTSSMDTDDMPVPDDLDPNRNYVLGKVTGKLRERGSCRSGSVSSAVFLVNEGGSSYSSTASWVKAVAASRSQQRALLTRQNSDSNLLSASLASAAGRTSDIVGLPGRRSFTGSTADIRDPEGSQYDLQVPMRSLTSSGYQSASDSTSVTAEGQLSPADLGRGATPTPSPARHPGAQVCLRPLTPGKDPTNHKVSYAVKCAGLGDVQIHSGGENGRRSARSSSTSVAKLKGLHHREPLNSADKRAAAAAATARVYRGGVDSRLQQICSINHEFKKRRQLLETSANLGVNSVLSRKGVVFSALSVSADGCCIDRHDSSPSHTAHARAVTHTAVEILSHCNETTSVSSVHANNENNRGLNGESCVVTTAEVNGQVEPSPEFVAEESCHLYVDVIRCGVEPNDCVSLASCGSGHVVLDPTPYAVKPVRCTQV